MGSQIKCVEMGVCSRLRWYLVLDFCPEVSYILLYYWVSEDPARHY